MLTKAHLGFLTPIMEALSFTPANSAVFKTSNAALVSFLFYKSVEDHEQSYVEKSIFIQVGLVLCSLSNQSCLFVAC